ncbi:Epidermis-specific secreted glycoprotein [Actinidia chinensis var. chinensis]|uniref:Epidermis-specific secreted glycoprotein n=1 Tax=Actinidia chinensis var. chinensis TaxID=1590841 RepID=A0A2R6RGA0_ACTCC|nr:Epidermis-specific secreted glycoprotein [Actinidia chinensis var. chinensis]
MSCLFSHPFLILSLFISLSITAQSIVPPSQTFKYINQGEFGEYIVEYDANYRVLPINTFPFTLCFYNVTPNAFILGLRMGHRRSESIMRWVWDTNRAKPVRENATLTFGTNGNLVLADVDGTVAWETGTANDGVVGLSLLPNGNLVLYDKNGKFVWQSFDHPTDTLLVGQAFRVGGPTWLISRSSNLDPSNGPYRFGMEKRYLAMYYKSKNSLKPLFFYKSDEFGNGKGSLANMVFNCAPETDEAYAFELRFEFDMKNSPSSGTYILSRPKYNSTYSMLRVGMDGNLRVYTYEEHVDWGAWEVTYILFDRDNGRESECQLPRRCGMLGVCDDDQCVACPRPQGFLGWSNACAPPVPPPCKGGAANVGYYNVVGVEHFTSAYVAGYGPIKVMECKDKCTKDCKCVGFFYKEESSTCLLVPELGTLVKVSNSSHVGYIKMSSK